MQKGAVRKLNPVQGGQLLLLRCHLPRTHARTHATSLRHHLCHTPHHHQHHPIPSQVETAWIDILQRGRLLLQPGPEFQKGYLMQVLSYSRKFHFGPFDLVQKKKSRSKRMSTKRLEQFFCQVGMPHGKAWPYHEVCGCPHEGGSGGWGVEGGTSLKEGPASIVGA